MQSKAVQSRAEWSKYIQIRVMQSRDVRSRAHHEVPPPQSHRWNCSTEWGVIQTLRWQGNHVYPRGRRYRREGRPCRVRSADSWTLTSSPCSRNFMLTYCHPTIRRSTSVKSVICYGGVQMAELSVKTHNKYTILKDISRIFFHFFFTEFYTVSRISFKLSGAEWRLLMLWWKYRYWQRKQWQAHCLQSPRN